MQSALCPGFRTASAAVLPDEVSQINRGGVEPLTVDRLQASYVFRPLPSEVSGDESLQGLGTTRALKLGGDDGIRTRDLFRDRELRTAPPLRLQNLGGPEGI